MVRYRRITGQILEKGSRDVVVVPRHGQSTAVYFRCPCDRRPVYIESPPHEITFDGQGTMSLDGSCGYKKNDEHPQNWCHFFIKGGDVEMCDDAQCPGGKG